MSESGLNVHFHGSVLKKRLLFQTPRELFALIFIHAKQYNYRTAPHRAIEINRKIQNKMIKTRSNHTLHDS